MTLANYFACSRYEDLPLGRFNGTHEYYLMPGVGALPTVESSSKLPWNLDFAVGVGGAIAYAEGDPSANQMSTFRPDEDGTLRHVMLLGWLVCIMNKERKTWERTGHALFMGMGKGRDRHPWSVLASEWEDDREGNEDEMIYAGQEDPWGLDVYGTLPDTEESTTLGRLTFASGTKPDKPLLLCFGAEFHFELSRLGGVRSDTSSKGEVLSLAKVMDWLDDEAKGQVVCYDANGKEYMRFDNQTKEYFYPRVPDTVLRGPDSPESRPLAFEERFRNASLSDTSGAREEANTFSGC